MCAYVGRLLLHRGAGGGGSVCSRKTGAEPVDSGTDLHPNFTNRSQNISPDRFKMHFNPLAKKENETLVWPACSQNALKGSRRAAASVCQRGSMQGRGPTDGGRRGGNMASSGSEEEGGLM